MSVTFAYKYLSHTVGILRHGAEGFTSAPKEVVLRDKSPLKIYRLQLGLNSRTLGPIESALTTRPMKATAHTLTSTYKQLFDMDLKLEFIGQNWDIPELGRAASLTCQVIQ
jgi:hypothetical protein